MERWLTRTYDRHGSLYLRVAATVAVAVGLLVGVPLLALAPIAYLELDLGDWALDVAAVDAAALVGFAVGIAAWPLRDLFAWSDGDRSPELVARAEQWAYAQPRRAEALGFAVAGVLGMPASVLVLTEALGDASTVDYVELGLGTVGAWAIAISTIFLLAELALLPIRASLAGYDVIPPRFARLSTLLVTAIAGFVYLAGLGVGFFFVERGDSGGDMLVIYAASLIPSGYAAAILLMLTSLNVLWPVGELSEGQRSVAAGDLSTRVPVTTSGELGELAIGFNTMVADLNHGSRELRASRSRIVAAADESRRKVERDLHDGAQQSLVLLNLKLGVAQRKAAKGAEDAGEAIGEARADLDRALDELRDLAHGIYPQVLTTDGLAAALAEAAAEAPIAVEASLDGADRHPPEIEAAVYFCCLEALQNAGKHAGEEAQVRLTLAETEAELSFEVADDGAGFDPASKNGSAGLQNMADRIGALGGELAVDSAPGEGTRVAGSLPVRAST